MPKVYQKYDFWHIFDTIWIISLDLHIMKMWQKSIRSMTFDIYWIHFEMPLMGCRTQICQILFWQLLGTFWTESVRAEASKNVTNIYLQIIWQIFDTYWNGSGGLWWAHKASSGLCKTKLCQKSIRSLVMDRFLLLFCVGNILKCFLTEA